jgi:hypothetical protein
MIQALKFYAIVSTIAICQLSYDYYSYIQSKSTSNLEMIHAIKQLDTAEKAYYAACTTVGLTTEVQCTLLSLDYVSKLNLEQEL